MHSRPSFHLAHGLYVSCQHIQEVRIAGQVCQRSPGDPVQRSAIAVLPAGIDQCSQGPLHRMRHYAEVLGSLRVEALGDQMDTALGIDDLLYHEHCIIKAGQPSGGPKASEQTVSCDGKLRHPFRHINVVHAYPLFLCYVLLKELMAAENGNAVAFAAHEISARLDLI